jgi:hypothetical protein
VVALALAGAPASAAYAQERPRTHEDFAARTSAALARPFPVSDLSVGDAPRIPYAFAPDADFLGGSWQLRRPDGSTLTLPRLTWGAWAATEDGAIGMAATEAGPELQQVSADGRVRSRLVQHFGLTVSPNDEIVGWLGDHGSPHVVGTCEDRSSADGGCTVFVNGAHRAEGATSHGPLPAAGHLVRVTDVTADGRVAGLDTGRGGCWSVVGPEGHRRFTTCDYFLDTFSPDGRRVLAEQARARWLTVRRFAMLGRDGHVVQAWTFDGGPHRSLSQLTWEDPHHLLGVLLAHGRWGIVRIGTDGTVEYAGAPVVAAVDGLTPYSLPLR